jgi:hypothetical protein
MQHQSHLPDRSSEQPRSASVRFEPMPCAVPRCRRFVRSQVPDPAMAERAELLVSELATNAVTHAGTPFVVTIHRRTDTVVVEVADELPPSSPSQHGGAAPGGLPTSAAGAHRPDPARAPVGTVAGRPRVLSLGPAAERDGGRGLRIVGGLASRWGIRPAAAPGDPAGAAGGKVVWFELRSGDVAPSTTTAPTTGSTGHDRAEASVRARSAPHGRLASPARGGGAPTPHGADNGEPPP